MPLHRVLCKRLAQQSLECWMSCKVQHLLMLCFYSAQIVNLNWLFALIYIVVRETLAIVVAKLRILFAVHTA